MIQSRHSPGEFLTTQSAHIPLNEFLTSVALTALAGLVPGRVCVKFGRGHPVVRFRSALKEPEEVACLFPALSPPLHHPRTVHNIYLDSPAPQPCLLNRGGVSERTKVRIRWHGPGSGILPQPVPVFKRQHGLPGRKEPVRPRPFCPDRRFCGAALLEVFHESGLHPEVMRTLGGLEPSLLDSYHRTRFKSAVVRHRITRDSGLRFQRLGPGRNALLCTGAHVPVRVLELRHWAADAAGGFPFRMAGFSKCAPGVEMLNGY